MSVYHPRAHEVVNPTAKPWLQRVPANPNGGSSVDGTVWFLTYDNSQLQRRRELQLWLAQHGHLLREAGRER